ncbi:hypothetical protein [uncultured Corynebacterium sp.]|uniref:hypothetical protein n=1 Tax=uncultured Corynebacterium sp. TaxID=159447 RepID=UPI0025D19181|nr:hypothetical protein [uncultured Corynebacterium sp.]
MERERAARFTGWALVAVGYAAVLLLWSLGDAAGWVVPVAAATIIVCVAVSVVGAVRLRLPDLWAAAFLAAMSPIMIPVWWAPDFAAG